MRQYIPPTSNDGQSLVNPSVDFNDAVAITSNSMARPRLIRAFMHNQKNGD